RSAPPQLEAIPNRGIPITRQSSNRIERADVDPAVLIDRVVYVDVRDLTQNEAARVRRGAELDHLVENALEYQQAFLNVGGDDGARFSRRQAGVFELALIRFQQRAAPAHLPHQLMAHAAQR